MIVVLVGPPGAGKGTQADILVKKMGFRKLSTGDALRKHIKLGTEIGKKISSVMAEGRLVSDDILWEVVQTELGGDNAEKVLLDGYPRNVSQAEALQGLQGRNRIKSVIHLDVDRDALIRRLSGRRTCPECSSTFHMTSNPPKKAGSCDVCGAGLVQRPDDEEDKVSVRLEVYDVNTKPVLDFYRKLGLCKTVSGKGDTEEVFREVEKILV